MAELTDEEKELKAERDKIKSEKKQLAQEQKKQKQEAKKRAKELAKKEEELDYEPKGSGFSVFLVALLLVLIWLGIAALVIKMDIGGVGTNIAAPILKDIPVVKYILPKDAITETTDVESYYGYTSLQDAVNQIQVLEKELDSATTANKTYEEQLATLKSEVERLKTFENNQVEFQRVKTQFYEEVVYSDKGPGAEAYMQYYQSIDPETAEYIYRQVVTEENISKEVEDYAAAYASMKPKEAAAIFEDMTDNLSLAAKILGAMSTDDRGKILGAMDSEVAAKITKIMEPKP
jgi:flagellar motility protein MotE (MotC chaperone)